LPSQTLIHLSFLGHPFVYLVTDLISGYLKEQQVQDMVNLKRWLEHIFESNWLPIESIFLPEKIFVYEFRGCENFVGRAKLINFDRQANRTSVGIVVKVYPQTNNSDKIVLVELRPTNGQEYLPASLHLMLLDNEGATCLEVKSKNDKKNSLMFDVSDGDNFSVKIALGDISVIENFVF
jgi:hypothetical protein